MLLHSNNSSHEGRTPVSEGNKKVYISSGKKVHIGEFGKGCRYRELSVSTAGEDIKSQDIRHVAINDRSSEVALADEIGTIFVVSLRDDECRIARLASNSAVTAVEFLASHSSTVVVAYENGLVLSIDTHTKEVLMNIRSEGNIPQRMLRCHPTRNVLAMVAENLQLSILDVNANANISSSVITESMISVQFERDMEAFSVLRNDSGLSFYSLSSGARLLGTCELPVSERKPVWTSTLSCHFNGGIRVIVSASNGRIYVWNVTKLDSSVDSVFSIEYVTDIDLPLKIAVPVRILNCGEGGLFVRCIVMGDSGNIMIIELNQSSWTFSILIDSEPIVLFGAQLDYYISATKIGKRRHHYRKRRLKRSDAKIKKQFQPMCLPIGPDNELLVCRGIDGTVRFFNIEDLQESGECSQGRSSSFEKTKFSQPTSKDKGIGNQDHVCVSHVDYDKGHKDATEFPSSVARISLQSIQFPPPASSFHTTKKKLQYFLNRNRSFPSRYRSMIWKFLLRLPLNGEAYGKLDATDIHPNFLSIQARNSLQSMKLLSRVQKICSRICTWCPLLAECSYLPQIAFPFTMVFENDDNQVATESVMSFFMWIGHSWLTSFPDPPSHILSTFNAILIHNDPLLAQHICGNNTNVGSICWGLISSIYTEIINTKEWFALMDFLVSRFEEQSLFYLTPIAILKATRASVLCISDSSLIASYYRNQQGIKADELIELIESIQAETPSTLLSFMSPPLDSRETKETLSASTGSPLFPLPSGEYPSYEGYSQRMVDMQMQDEAKCAESRKELEDRRKIVENIEQSTHLLETEHREWMLHHEAVAEAEMKRQVRSMTEEKEYLQKILELDEHILRTKISSLLSLEQIVKEEESLLGHMANKSSKLLKMNDEKIELRKQYHQNKTRHNEIVDNVNKAMSDRFSRVHLARLREEWSNRIIPALDMKTSKESAALKLSTQEWKVDDEKSRLLRSNLAQTLQENLNSEVYSRLDAEIHQLGQRIETTMNEHVLNIENIRAIRSARIKADLASTIAEKDNIDYQKEELTKSVDETEKFAHEVVDIPHARLLERSNKVRCSYENLLNEEKYHIESAKESNSRIRSANVKKSWAIQKESQLRDTLDAERAVQEQSIRIKRSNMQTEACSHLFIMCRILYHIAN